MRTLRDLLAVLQDNNWHRGPDDVEIMIETGDGTYTLAEVHDWGNHIVLVSDRGTKGEE